MTLNKQQTAVVDAARTGGAIVVEACPGSGKTRTIESVVAALIENGADPMRILCCTFSRKGASEMRWRIARTVLPDLTDADLKYFEDPNSDELDDDFDRTEWCAADPKRLFITQWVCTIHAVCYRLLKAYGFKLQVLHGRSQWEVDGLLKDAIKELDWNESLKTVKAYISHAILNLVEPPDSYRFFAAQLDGEYLWCVGNLTTCYTRYMDYMKAHKLVDFDMMQARVLYLLENDPTFTSFAVSLFDHVIVDEAQDTSKQQSTILWTLAVGGNVLYCGDVDQSMYAFRGAVPAVLRENFEERWSKVQRYNLPTNYRSTTSIIDTAAKLISYNYTSPDAAKYLKPFDARTDAPAGAPVQCMLFNTFEALCAETANLLKGTEPSDWFVLSRTRAECAAIHTALIAAGIPAINKVGGLLFGAPHIKKVLAYARLAIDYAGARDDLEVLGEIANVATKDFRAPLTRRRHLDSCRETRTWINCGCPVIYEEGKDYCAARYYGKAAIEAAGDWNGIEEQTFETNKGGYPTMRSKGAADLVDFVKRIEKKQDNALAALEYIITECVLPWMQAEEGVDNDDPAENGKSEEFDVLLHLVEPDEDLEHFLQRIDELGQGNGNNDAESVLVGTYHWSKGAERERVLVNITRCPIVPPKPRPGALPVGRPATIEEERRLVFVGITRAKSEAYVVQAQEWNGAALPVSQFIEEMQLQQAVQEGAQDAEL